MQRICKLELRHMIDGVNGDAGRNPLALAISETLETQAFVTKDAVYVFGEGGAFEVWTFVERIQRIMMSLDNRYRVPSTNFKITKVE